MDYYRRRARREASVEHLIEAELLSRGRTTQVWEITMTDAAGKLVCISRCTMAVLEKPSEY